MCFTDKIGVAEEYPPEINEKSWLAKQNDSVSYVIPAVCSIAKFQV
jgi:hypothetical protein